MHDQVLGCEGQLVLLADLLHFSLAHKVQPAREALEGFQKAANRIAPAKKYLCNERGGFKEKGELRSEEVRGLILFMDQRQCYATLGDRTTVYV